jgi:hypothetical protein
MGVRFIYTATSDIHVEFVELYSTDRFLMAFRRFICAEGTPLRIHSDEGNQWSPPSKWVLGFWRSATVGQQEGNGVAPCSQWWSAFQRTSWENDRNPKDSQQQAHCWRPVGRRETLNQTYCTYLSEAVSGHIRPYQACHLLHWPDMVTPCACSSPWVWADHRGLSPCGMYCSSTVNTVGAVWLACHWQTLWFFKGLCLGNQSIFWQAVLCSSQHGPYLSLIKFSSVSAKVFKQYEFQMGYFFIANFAIFSWLKERIWNNEFFF